MSAARAWLARAAGLRHRNRQEEDLQAELAAHLQLHIDDGVRSGLTPEEAHRQAILKLGGVEVTKEIYRDQRGIPFIETLAKDLRYALRMLRKNPGFSSIAIASLALGIGANTAIFSVVYAVMLRPLPYPESDQLVRVARVLTRADVSMTEYAFLKDGSNSITLVAAYQGAVNRRLVQGGEDSWTMTLAVTPGFFRTLGTPLALGREFNETEAHPGSPRAAILSDALWKSSFRRDPSVLGKAVAVDGISHVVVGIAPPGFWFPERSDLFTSLRLNGGTSDLGANNHMIARVKSGVALRQADAELALVSRRFLAANPEFNGGKYKGLAAIPYREWLVGDSGRKLLMLLGAVGLLLLIACLNLLSLLLARSAARQSEVALRLALGSSRSRLLQQFLMENMVLGLTGAGVGLLGAYWLLDGFVALVPFALPAPAAISINLPVLLFTAATGLGAILFISIAPFLSAARLPIHETLKQSPRSVSNSGGRRGLRDLLLMGEVAISATLTVGAALLAQSLYQLNTQPLGFTPDGLLTFWAPPAYKGPGSGLRMRSLEVNLAEELRTLPGVQHVAAINVLPLAGKNNFPAQRSDHPEQSIGGMEVRFITPDYLETMRIPLRSGRPFSNRDNADAPPVVLINETLARLWWPEGNQNGDRIDVGKFRGKMFMEESTREVVGVVADTKTVLLTEAPRPTLFLPAAQVPWSSAGMHWVIRGDLSTGLNASVRQVIQRVAPEQRVERLRAMTDIVAATTSGTRFDAALFGSFAALAMLVAAIGVYGLLSFSVARRTREIGLHIALGATRREILWLIVRQGLIPVTGGIVLGLASALALSGSMSKMLFGVKPADPLSLVAVAVLLTVVGCTASYFPARRAAAVDPLVALRSE